MKILETINNVLDTTRSIADAFTGAPEMVREYRALRADIDGNEYNNRRRKEAEATEAKTLAHNRELCSTICERDKRIIGLEIENRKLLDQNWKLLEERDTEIAKRETSQVELATLRAKLEPAASGIVEPDYGVGFEKCEKEEATEACLNMGDGWGTWLNVVGFLSFGRRDDDYRFRRPIAKPVVEAEPQWVACTAEEAKKHYDDSEFFSPFAGSRGEWQSCGTRIKGELDCGFAENFAYRTKAQLSEWVTVSFEFITNRFAGKSFSCRDLQISRNDGESWHDVLMLNNFSVCGESYRVRRSTIPVGTVLG